MTHLPLIHSESISGSEALIEIEIKSDLAYLKGHFDAYPLVPGVVQLHWAMHFGKKHFDIQGNVTQGSQIKFSNVMTPGERLTLSLIYDANCLIYSFYNADKKFSAGKLYV